MVKIVITISLIILWMAGSWAQEMIVPVETQFNLFLKILTFDRNLKARVGDELVIGLVYQGKFRVSLNARNEAVKALSKSPINKIEGIPIRQVSIDLDESDLDSTVFKEGVDVLYISPLRAVVIKKITDLSRAKKITTLTGVPEYVESGLAVGIGTKGEKPLIIINLLAAKKEGADFSSQLLKLAKVIE